MNPEISRICEEVASAVGLEEGPAGIEEILRVIFTRQPIAPRAVAGRTGLPIPLVSAIRRELEKAGWLLRKRGMVLSETAYETLCSVWGNGQGSPVNKKAAEDEDRKMETYIPLPLTDSPSEQNEPFFELLEEILEERPPADPRLDQSHATLETVLRRVELFIDRGYIQGRRSLFLGDDDLTSLFTFLFLRHFVGESAVRSSACVVVEVDPRLVSYLRDVAQSEDLPVAVLEADLRTELPTPLRDAFDFFFTDPPYTSQGVELFLDRGCQALAEKGLRKSAVAVPLSPPSLQLGTQKAIFSKGFVIDYLDPRFNRYEGATMQGGTSALYGLHLVHPGRYKGVPHRGRLYTAQKKTHRKKRNHC